MKNEYVKDTDYSVVFNNLAFNYWRNYYIKEFEDSDIYKKIHDAASNGQYEIKLENIKEKDLRMLHDFGISFTITHSYRRFNIRYDGMEVTYDITVSWRE